ncbi:transcription antitermination factor NusB [Leptospira sp. 201903070]|uniref:Transcription antitermination protein NusB n=2 Tax=Leptospira TaxID=171 RepID=A0A4V3JVI4_9LEPT|nr:MULTISPECIES: transcription antitermination factor NusB [Leptospira]MBM9499132.1 transcription antitermination factor NusB [Leptospira ainazelensis]MBM9575807.1 transcription antitermination factor NusB [Leptospira ainlahdjerensis]RHX83792.1 transcription antitermination factor NusB [Leptospira stimsonii]TGK18463.1 transcription antitermination factor NusB [Leptospira stimsonii]TGM21897.1 transcription antitermination factor NusB [Leptospira stimsonii]
MSARRTSREIAVMALYQLELTKPPLKDVLKFKWYDKKTEQEERDFAISIVNGVVKNQEQIDTLIKKYSKNWDFSRISVVNKAILRLSVYALLYTWEVPKNVTIDEAVELTKEFESEESARFVNGILDAILKNEIKSDG